MVSIHPGQAFCDPLHQSWKSNSRQKSESCQDYDLLALLSLVCALVLYVWMRYPELLFPSGLLILPLLVLWNVPDELLLAKRATTPTDELCVKQHHWKSDVRHLLKGDIGFGSRAGLLNWSLGLSPKEYVLPHFMVILATVPRLSEFLTPRSQVACLITSFTAQASRPATSRKFECWCIQRGKV